MSKDSNQIDPYAFTTLSFTVFHFGLHDLPLCRELQIDVSVLYPSPPAWLTLPPACSTHWSELDVLKLREKSMKFFHVASFFLTVSAWRGLPLKPLMMWSIFADLNPPYLPTCLLTFCRFYRLGHCQSTHWCWPLQACSCICCWVRLYFKWLPCVQLVRKNKCESLPGFQCLGSGSVSWGSVCGLGLGWLRTIRYETLKSLVPTWETYYCLELSGKDSKKQYTPKQRNKYNVLCVFWRERFSTMDSSLKKCHDWTSKLLSTEEELCLLV